MANQAWQITTAGSIALKDLGPVPKPGTKQVLVRIHAVSLNYRDRVVIDRSPSYPVVAKENLIPGSDGAGTVEVAGPDSVWKKGDRVIIQPNQWTSGYDERDFEIDKVLGGGDIDGTFRRWIVLNDSCLFKAPDALTFEEACTVHTAGVTAFRSLFYGGVELQPGTTVLTQGTGGVSCYAIMVSGSTTLNRSGLTRPR
jgi:NADPH:quinone reductase-like Zn-dependent oxidoreductase